MLEAASLRREFVPAPSAVGAVSCDARSNDYLGLTSDVSRETPVGAAGSRLVVGSLPEHAQLERELADWLGTDNTLLFSSAYAANVGVVSALGVQGDTVFSDALNHASLIDGCRLARAEVVVFPHLDLEALADELRERANGPGQCWVVTETYFGMDGDSPDLGALRRLCDEHGAGLVVDEAHALGVFGPEGRGLCAATGVRPDVLVGGMGKALGAQGGFVAASRPYVEWFWNRARPFVFSTGVSPLLCRATSAQLARVRGAEALRERLRGLEERLERRLQAAGVMLPARRHGPVFPIVLGSEDEALRAAEALRREGVLVQPIRPPTVPTGQSRLRISLRADMTVDAVDALAAALVACVGCGKARPAVSACVAGAPPEERAPAPGRGPPGSSIQGDIRGALQRAAAEAGTSRSPAIGADAERRPERRGSARPVPGANAAPGGAGKADASIARSAELGVEGTGGEALGPPSSHSEGGEGGASVSPPRVPPGPSRGGGGARPEAHPWVVLGTGTQVGKTFVSVGLARVFARQRPVLALKPIETGWERLGGEPAPQSDAGQLEAASFHVKHIRPHPLYAFRDPVTPSLAARREQCPIRVPDVQRWLHDARHLAGEGAVLIVETAGGVFSPLGPDLTNYDMATALGPARWILVAPDRLGVLHDVSATLRAMSALGRSADALVLSAPESVDASTGNNAAELREMGFSLPIVELPRGSARALADLAGALESDRA